MAALIGDNLKSRALWFTAPRTAALRDETVSTSRTRRGARRGHRLGRELGHGAARLPRRGPGGSGAGSADARGELRVPDQIRLRRRRTRPRHRSRCRSSCVRGIPSSSTIRTRRFSSFPHSFPSASPTASTPCSGVFFANLETALNVVHDTPLRLGETAIVFGPGVVGLLVTRLLNLAGAGQVLVVDPLENRRKLALAAGARRRVRARGAERAHHGDYRRTWGGRGRGGQWCRGCFAGRHRCCGDRGDGRRGLVVRHEARHARSRGTFPQGKG